jgi:hypothetical protein
MDPLTIVALLAFALMAVCWLTLPTKSSVSTTSATRTELSGSMPAPQKV